MERVRVKRLRSQAGSKLQVMLSEEAQRDSLQHGEFKKKFLGGGFGVKSLSYSRIRTALNRDASRQADLKPQDRHRSNYPPPAHLLQQSQSQQLQEANPGSSHPATSHSRKRHMIFAKSGGRKAAAKLTGADGAVPFAPEVG